MISKFKKKISQIKKLKKNFLKWIRKRRNIRIKLKIFNKNFLKKEMNQTDLVKVMKT